MEKLLKAGGVLVSDNTPEARTAARALLATTQVPPASFDSSCLCGRRAGGQS